MKLQPLSKTDMEIIRRWRNEVPETLRTPFMLTEEMQEDYYHNVICNRESRTRYWGLWVNDSETIENFIGYGGIENIEWENSRGEISLLIDPLRRGNGYGRQAVELFLDQAFNYMNLYTVWGEVYMCGHVNFWAHLAETYSGEVTKIQAVKYFNGNYYGALHFTFFKEAFNESR